MSTDENVHDVMKDMLDKLKNLVNSLSNIYKLSATTHIIHNSLNTFERISTP